MATIYNDLKAVEEQGFDDSNDKEDDEESSEDEETDAEDGEYEGFAFHHNTYCVQSKTSRQYPKVGNNSTANQKSKGSLTQGSISVMQNKCINYNVMQGRP